MFTSRRSRRTLRNTLQHSTGLAVRCAARCSTAHSTGLAVRCARCPGRACVRACVPARACERRPALPGPAACTGAARPRPAQPPRRARSASPVSAGLHARPTRTAPTSRAASGAPPTRRRFRIASAIRAPTSAPGLGSPLPHLHRDWASSHIFTSTPDLGSPISCRLQRFGMRACARSGFYTAVGHHMSCLCAMQPRHLARRMAAVFYAGRKAGARRVGSAPTSRSE
jgi:hypothetical protein